METQGPIGSLVALLGSAGKHLELLAALLAQEGREAGGRLIRALVLLAAGLLLAGLGYIFLVLGLAFVLAAVFQWPWLWIALGLGLAHLAAAAFLLKRMSHYLKVPAFSGFRAEVQKDLDLLHKNLPTHGQNPAA
ncbi:MAG TPA: phage holin family protein [Chthoniobacterales bacterium]